MKKRIRKIKCRVKNEEKCKGERQNQENKNKEDNKKTMETIRK